MSAPKSLFGKGSTISSNEVLSRADAQAFLERVVKLSKADAISATLTGGYTSAFILWYPVVAVNVLGLSLYTRGAYENATGDSVTFFGNAGTSIGSIALTTSTAYNAGLRFTTTSLTQTALAAATPVLAKYVTSTCSKGSVLEVAIDYGTTG